MSIMPKEHFLRYAQTLTGSRSEDVRELVRLVADEFPTACEAVFFYACAAVGGVDAARIAHEEGTWFANEWTNLSSVYDGLVDRDLAYTEKEYPPRYGRAIRGYVGHLAHDDRVSRSKKSLARRIEKGMESSATDLETLAHAVGLRPADMHAFLSEGADNLITLEQARMAAMLVEGDSSHVVPTFAAKRARPEIIARLRHANLNA